MIGALRVNYLNSCLLITSANSLDPGQASQKTPGLIWIQTIYFLKSDFEKNQQTIKKHEKFPSIQRVNYIKYLKKGV